MKNNEDNITKYEELIKSYLEFAEKCHALERLFIAESLIYDYMRNFFAIKKNGSSYSTVTAIHDAMIAIQEIGNNIFSENENYWREQWFSF